MVETEQVLLFSFLQTNMHAYHYNNNLDEYRFCDITNSPFKMYGTVGPARFDRNQELRDASAHRCTTTSALLEGTGTSSSTGVGDLGEIV